MTSIPSPPSSFGATMYLTPVTAVIGAGSVVLTEVPDGSTVVGVPGRVVRMNNKELPQEMLDQVDLPDPVREDITNLQHANSELTNRLLSLEEELRELKRENKAVQASE